MTQLSIKGMIMPMCDFAETLKKRIEADGLSMRHVSKASGLGPDTVKRIIAEGYSPRLENVIKLAEFFGCGLDELVFDKLTPNKKPFDEEILKDAVIRVDGLIKDNQKTKSAEEKVAAYLKCYDILLASQGSSEKERSSAIMRLIDEK